MMGDVVWELAFDDVRVPVENLIGKEGDGMRAAQSWITAGRLYQACRGLGVAQRSIEMATSYAQQRVTFGQKLADRQAVQFMVSDSYMEHRMTQLLVYNVAARTDAGMASRHESLNEMPIAKMWRDARSFMITEGPVEVMRSVLARDIFRQAN